MENLYFAAFPSYSVRRSKLMTPNLPKPAINDALYLAAGYSIEQQADVKIRPLAEMERLYIEMVINLCGGSIPRASALLLVSPSTIYRKKAAWDKGAVQNRD
jgi:DNA-binding NtrC family response regulator